ncbi:MAG: class I SAM-dependent methyltransferase [Alphaproteobacteria bacterium]|nr:class I SAM-dependent methyltransferase [Alphaproteobacteria bacterium]
MQDAGEAKSLAQHLARRIRAFGPITVEAFMADVLTHSQHGYYMARQPFGRGGDFITAPEVSQMFGELIGVWMADAWQRMGRPSAVRIVEMGPGRGVLMCDLLRAAGSVPELRAAANVHLVEISPALQQVQRQALAQSGWEAQWHSTLANVPDGPLLLVANELFDALPIRQFVRTRAGWCERLVDATSDETFRLVLTPGPSPAAAMLPARVRETAPLESVAEVCPAGIALAAELAARVKRDGGAALVIDYGTTEFGARDTLQAVARHQSHPVLDAPGTADLCAHVDFAMIGQAARESGARLWGPTTQGAFLERLGIQVRAEALARRATPAQKADIESALRRLTGAEGMGSLFQVLVIASPALTELAGFL